MATNRLTSETISVLHNNPNTKARLTSETISTLRQVPTTLPTVRITSATISFLTPVNPLLLAPNNPLYL